MSSTMEPTTGRKKPVVKQTNVKMSGYIMITDPKDIAKIEDLKHKVNILKTDLAKANREAKYLRKQMSALQPLSSMKREIADLMRELTLFGNRKMSCLIYDWPLATSNLAKIAKKCNRESE